MKKIILGLSILAIGAATTFVACKKNTNNSTTTTNKGNSGSQTHLQRTSLGAMQLSTVGEGYNVDIDLMDDYTWSGDMIFDTSTVFTNDLAFSNPQTSISISSGDSDKLNVIVVDTANSETTNLVFDHFTSASSGYYQFDIYANGVFLKTVNIVSNQFNSLSDFKTSFIGNWNGNSSLLKTTWIVPVVRAVVAGLTAISIAVINHCDKVIEAVRSTCLAPNRVKVGFCSAECVPHN